MAENISISELGDEALVACARDGRAEAFELLCARHYDNVFRLGFRLAGNRSDAQDIAQDTFVRAAAAIVRFRGDSKFQTWVYRIAVNVSHDLRAKRGRQLQLAEEASKAPPPEAYDGRGELILAALDSLAETERSAIVLTVYEEMSHAEAARVLDCAETTISWRLFRARQKLKKALKDHPDA